MLQEVLVLFKNMLSDVSGQNPIHTTMVCVLSVCSQLKEFYSEVCVGFIEKTICRPENDISIETGLVDMYAKCGYIDAALYWKVMGQPWEEIGGVYFKQALELQQPAGGVGSLRNEEIKAAMFVDLEISTFSLYTPAFTCITILLSPSVAATASDMILKLPKLSLATTISAFNGAPIFYKNFWSAPRKPSGEFLGKETSVTNLFSGKGSSGLIYG
ncbi:hypothetical protein V6N11_017062 [Hibiscus sabdariffa]|uniref:Pentatricopeptide repeat-containing protein n=1 Tax=Hibiscus sabdariffa TaxID=183260 RepID=A0ABR2TXQ0_9ROSI